MCVKIVTVLWHVLPVMSNVRVLTSNIKPDDMDLYSKAEECASKVHYWSTKIICLYVTSVLLLIYM